MEIKINLHIEYLPEGYYLGTSDEIQGLVVQSETITGLIDAAKDVAKKLIEARNETENNYNILDKSFDYPLIINY